MRDLKRMPNGFVGLDKVFQSIGLAAGAWAMSSAAFAEELVGQPTPDAIGLQRPASELARNTTWFFDWILLPMMGGITLLVFVLLLIVVVRFNKRANPTPAKFTHNSLIEVIWTVAPIMILVVISVFSFSLLYKYNNMPKPDVTVKTTGYQWYWGYAYPDQKIDEITSVMLQEDAAKAQHRPYRLAVDNPMVVPVNKVIRIQLTGNDVIHSFALPAFKIKQDANPGHLTETWFKAEKVGVYYGQCSELCGVNHAFMPIEIRVVSQADFNAFVAAHTAAKPAAVAAAAPAVGAAQ